jgi:hypothetical protein
MPITRPFAKRLLAPAAISITGAALAAVTLAAGVPGDGVVDEVRATLEKWVEVRRVISKERQDWALGREILSDRVAVQRREVETLRGSIAEAQSSVAEAEAKRAELVAENEALASASAELAGVVRTLEARTKELLVRLPDPIRERVKPLSQRLPEDPDATKLSLSERFQNVVGVLNEVDKFQREITLSSEVRALGDGTSAEVTSIYFGIGQGYYVGANGGVAGCGSGAGASWTWTADSSASPDVTAAIEVLKNERVAQFVRLPVSLQ